VALVRAPELTLLKIIKVADAPGWAELADHDRTCLVANTRANSLSFISVGQRSEVLRLPTGKGPKHITVARIPAAVLERSAMRP
jgi:hypothetical protein